MTDLPTYSGRQTRRWTAATGGTLLLIGAAPLTVAGLVAASAATNGARPDRLAAWVITFAALGLAPWVFGSSYLLTLATSRSRQLAALLLLTPWVLLMLVCLRSVVIACQRAGGRCG